MSIKDYSNPDVTSLRSELGRGRTRKRVKVLLLNAGDVVPLRGAIKYRREKKNLNVRFIVWPVRQVPAHHK